MVKNESLKAQHVCTKSTNGEKIQRPSKVEKSTMHQMRQRLLHLRNACTIYQHSDINTLSSKQKSILQLWEHVQDCRDKDCERKYCKSSCLILEHYFRCKRLNKNSKCKLCGPVEIHIERCCRGVKKLKNNKKCDDQGNSTSLISHQKKETSGEAQISQIAGRCLKAKTLPHKKHCNVVHWDKSVKGGTE